MSLELVVVTPEGEAISEAVEQVVLPGEAGEFGVLESHERFLTPLAPGAMKILSAGEPRWAAVSSGFAEVDGARVVVLVDRCALGSEIDPEEVQARRGEIEARLREIRDDVEHLPERRRLQAAIAQTELELDVAGR